VSEAHNTIQGYGLSRKDATAAVTQAIIDIRNGGLEKGEAEVIINAVDCQTRRMQVTLNAIKLQLQVKAAGEDFGKLLKNARKLQDDGYDEEDGNADD
jgi:hypothetical protein